MKILLAFALYVSLACGPLLAATLNFDTFRPGVTREPLSFPGVAISESSGGALFVYGTGDFGMPVGGGVCGLQSDFACTGDVSLLFIGPVSNLTFKGFDASISDRATISAYADDVLLSVLLVSGGSDDAIGIDFTGISGITRVAIVDRSSTISRGIAYGDFSFDIDPPGPPPPPTTPPDVLQFDAFARGVNEDTLDLGSAILRETSGGRIFVYRSGDFDIPQNGGLCAYDANFNCMGDLLLEFKLPIFDLAFSGFFAKATDSAFVSLFDGDVLIYSGLFSGNAAGTIRFDFTNGAKLTKIMIADASDPVSRGIAYGDFRYRPYVAPVAPVPVPATVLLLIVGLAFLSALRPGAKRRAAEA